MTQVAFHFGAVDKQAYACRLLRKAAASGARVAVVVEPGEHEQLDAALWAVSPIDFVSHCGVTAPPVVRERSTVLLVQSASQSDASRKVLVNLGASIPVGFEAFERVIEVVSTDEDDRNRGRQRWKHYTQQGYTITRHDLVAKGGAA